MPALSEARRLLGLWGKGTFPNRASCIRYHFRRHGQAVGARDVWQYLRKAEGFLTNLRRAHIVHLPDGRTRCTKQGRYIILDEDGTILSFGVVR